MDLLKLGGFGVVFDQQTGAPIPSVYPCHPPCRVFTRERGTEALLVALRLRDVRI